MALFGLRRSRTARPASAPVDESSTRVEPDHVAFDELGSAGPLGALMWGALNSAGVTWLINGAGSPRELFDALVRHVPRFEDFTPFPAGVAEEAAYLPSGGDQVFFGMFHVNTGSLLVLPIFNNPSASAFGQEMVPGVIKMKESWNIDFCTPGGMVKPDALSRLANPRAVNMNDILIR